MLIEGCYRKARRPPASRIKAATVEGPRGVWAALPFKEGLGFVRNLGLCLVKEICLVGR